MILTEYDEDKTMRLFQKEYEDEARAGVVLTALTGENNSH